MIKQTLFKLGGLPIIFTPGALFTAKLMYHFEPTNAIDKVRAVKCPIMFIQEAKDNHVPIKDAYRLKEASGNHLDEIWIVPGAGHSQAYSADPAQYISWVSAFLDKCSCLNQMEQETTISRIS
jgi:fermentation-respiration switch protein FrsA (DUF1100 family)